MFGVSEMLANIGKASESIEKLAKEKEIELKEEQHRQMDMEKLKSLSIPQLRAKCDELGLPIRGSKIDLLERIEKFKETGKYTESSKPNKGNAADDEDDNDVDIEGPDLPEFSHMDIMDFILDKDNRKQQVTCTLCMIHLPILNETAIATHCNTALHNTKFEEYRQNAKGKGLVQIYVHCDICNLDIVYPQLERHMDSPRHYLNQLLTDNGVDTRQGLYAEIQTEVDKINKPDDPIPGLNFVHEGINAETYGQFRVSYCCMCCHITKKNAMESYEMIRHLKSNKHAFNALKKIDQDAFQAVCNSIESFNNARPYGAKTRSVMVEAKLYVQDNPEQFFKRHKFKTRFFLGDDYEEMMEKKYSDEAAVRQTIPDAMLRFELELDVKAKIQDKIENCKKKLLGVDYMIERQYPTGECEYYCVICRKELDSPNQAVSHFLSFIHKKRYLQRNQVEAYLAVDALYAWVPNISKDQLVEKNRKTEEKVMEIAEDFLDGFPRPTVKVVLKAGYIIKSGIKNKSLKRKGDGYRSYYADSSKRGRSSYGGGGAGRNLNRNQGQGYASGGYNQFGGQQDDFGGGYGNRGGEYGNHGGGYNQGGGYGNHGSSSGYQGGRYGKQDGEYGNRGDRYGNYEDVSQGGGYGNRGNRYGNHGDGNQSGGYSNRRDGNKGGGYGNQGGGYGNQSGGYGNRGDSNHGGGYGNRGDSNHGGGYGNRGDAKIGGNGPIPLLPGYQNKSVSSSVGDKSPAQGSSNNTERKKTKGFLNDHVTMGFRYKRPGFGNIRGFDGTSIDQSGPGSKQGDYSSNQGRDYSSNQGRDYSSNQGRDYGNNEQVFGSNVGFGNGGSRGFGNNQSFDSGGFGNQGGMMMGDEDLDADEAAMVQRISQVLCKQMMAAKRQGKGFTDMDFNDF